MAQRMDEARTKSPAMRLRYTWIPYAKISPHLKRAMIAAEDAKFVDHSGFDWDGIQTALDKNERRGRVVAGGSTITQQLAKNLFLSPEKSYVRKGEEAVVTVLLEAMLPKAAHPGDLSQCDRVGQRRVRRRSRSAAILRHPGVAAVRGTGGTPRRNGARATPLRTQSRFGVPRRTRRDDSRADALGRSAVAPSRPHYAIVEILRPFRLESRLPRGDDSRPRHVRWPTFSTTRRPSSPSHARACRKRSRT